MRRQTIEQLHARNVIASRALGLPGFVVLSTAEYGGELEQLIETVQVEAFCRSCGVRAVRTAGDLPGCGTWRAVAARRC